MSSKWKIPGDTKSQARKSFRRLVCAIQKGCGSWCLSGVDEEIRTDTPS